MPDVLEKSDGIVWRVCAARCVACGKSILELHGKAPDESEDVWTIWPKGSARPLSRNVPRQYGDDFTDACVVLPDSAKASAALSRRCLQRLMHEHFKIKIGFGDLAKEIGALLDSGRLPSHVGEVVDGIRHFGNFAAHPIPDGKTGEVVDVEPHEAEWCLDVLEQLFDFCFVQPANTRAKKDALNKKLAAAKKPPMKGPT